MGDREVCLTVRPGIEGRAVFRRGLTPALRDFTPAGIVAEGHPPADDYRTGLILLQKPGVPVIISLQGVKKMSLFL